MRYGDSVLVTATTVGRLTMSPPNVEMRDSPVPRSPGCWIETSIRSWAVFMIREAHCRGELIERAVTIKAIIAWRLAAMTLLGREMPALPVEVFCTRVQIRVMRHFAARRRLAAPGNLGLAVRTMAILGGYLYRKNAPPGHQKIWEGWTRLSIMGEAY